jgi:ABC-2 type transport system permease protein
MSDTTVYRPERLTRRGPLTEWGRLTAGLGFPLALLGILGAVPSFRHADPAFAGASVLDVYVPVLVLFSIGLFALTALPAGLTGDPAGGRARFAVAIGMSAVGTVAVLAAARTGYHVHLPRQPIGFLIALLLAAATLLATGVMIGRRARNTTVAQYAGTILLAVLMYFSGLFGPVAAMPAALRFPAEATPLGAAARAMQDAALGHWPSVVQLLTAAAWTVVTVFGAWRVSRPR